MNPYVEHVKNKLHAVMSLDFKGPSEKNWDNPLELYHIAVGLCMIGLFENAIKLYDRILILNENWIDIIDLRARAYWAKHEYKNAIDDWKVYLAKRQDRCKKIGLPINIFAIDNVFTVSFGNYGFLYPILKNGYSNKNDIFYYHPEIIRNLTNPSNQREQISNSALFEIYSDKISTNLSRDYLNIIEVHPQIISLPFYCGIDPDKQPTHFQNAFAENLLQLEKINKKIHSNLIVCQDLKKKLNGIGLDIRKLFILIHVRESGYWGRTGDKSNSTKNADIYTYLDCINYLLGRGYQVVRLGDNTMKKLPLISNLFDLAHSPYKSADLDLFLIRNAYFMMCTCSGPFQVAGIFDTPLLATNWIPVHILPYSKNDLVLLKKIKRIKTQSYLNFEEILSLDFAEFSFYNFLYNGLEVVDNSKEEILSATKYMLCKLEDKTTTNVLRNLMDKTINRFSTANTFYKRRVISEAKILDVE